MFAFVFVLKNPPADADNIISQTGEFGVYLHSPVNVSIRLFTWFRRDDNILDASFYDVSLFSRILRRLWETHFQQNRGYAIFFGKFSDPLHLLHFSGNGTVSLLGVCCHVYSLYVGAASSRVSTLLCLFAPLSS